MKNLSIAICGILIGLISSNLFYERTPHTIRINKTYTLIGDHDITKIKVDLTRDTIFEFSVEILNHDPKRKWVQHFYPYIFRPTYYRKK